MSTPQISVSCDSYKNSVFYGFSRLQEQQQFVDLTLAADGHLVKVHKNIIALASPYLKEMLQSTSSQDPVIFLNNVHHKVLTYLLEYIYQGEVNVPQDCIESFIQVSESLHIAGIKKLTPPKATSSSSSTYYTPTAETQDLLQTESLIQNPPQPILNNETSIIQPEVQTPVITLDKACNEIRPNNFAACITINSDHNFEVQQFADNVQVLNIDHSYQTDKSIQDQQINPTDTFQDLPIIEVFDSKTDIPQGNDMEADLSLVQDQHPDTLTEKEVVTLNPTVSSASIVNSEMPLLDLTLPLKLDKESTEALKTLAQFSVTERGAVQIIVSRYIYCSHHNSRGGRKHRWRCLDYRRSRCPAYIDSLDERIILRKGVHNHEYHDNKISKKHKQGLIFHSIAQAKESRDLPRNTGVEADENVDLEKAIDFNVIPVYMNEGD